LTERKVSNPIPRRGEIWMASTPGQPDDPHQPRPALIVSENVRNRMTDDVMVIPLFSRGRLGPTRVAIPGGAGGLTRASVAFCEEITTVDRDFLGRRPLGKRIEPPLMAAVVRAVRRAIGEVVAEP
jgi:mRNA interferase MazF